MSTRNRLELTWVGKDQRPRLEPRILLEEPALSYHAPARRGDADQFDNLLIHGDNLLALKALESEYAGKVKCIFIDPPYNTGSAFTHYDDGLEHSLWLSMMRDRLEILRGLLREDGSIWITIDDNEAHYLKVLCDEVFGRTNFVANIVWQSKDTPGNNASTIAQTHNMLLVFKKSDLWKPNLVSSLIYRFPEWASAGISARRTRSVSVSYSLVFFRPHALRFRRFSRSSMAFSANSANFRRNFPVHVDRQSSAG